jgi:CBS-domain-containing membrane protein
MQISAMMQRTVVTASPDTSLAEAQRLLLAHRIRHLPVVMDGCLVGLVTDRDIRDAMPSPATTLSQSEVIYHMGTVSIEACMTRQVVTAVPGDDAVAVARHLLERRFGCLPVVERDQLVGIVTEVDFLQGFLAIAAPAGELMLVKHYMHTTVETARPDEPIDVAYHRMKLARIRHLPVVTQDRTLIGILTDRDVRQAHASDDPHLVAYERKDLLARMTVGQVMTTRVITVGENTPIADAGQLLLDRRISGLPVVRDHTVLEGIVTITDLIRAFVQQ